MNPRWRALGAAGGYLGSQLSSRFPPPVVTCSYLGGQLGWVDLGTQLEPPCPGGALALSSVHQCVVVSTPIRTLAQVGHPPPLALDHPGSVLVPAAGGHKATPAVNVALVVSRYLPLVTAGVSCPRDHNHYLWFRGKCTRALSSVDWLCVVAVPATFLGAHQFL